MNTTKGIEKFSICEDLKEKLKVQQEGQVVVHFQYKCIEPRGIWLKAWKTTYLFDTHSSHKSELLYVEQLPLQPNFVSVKYRESFSFTMIFSPLPKDCTHFDLKEIIPETGEFCFTNIARNATDIYHIFFT
jgi:hypothetical protein